MEEKVTLKKDGTPRKVRTNYERKLNTVPRSDIGSKRPPIKPDDKRIGNTNNLLRKTFGKPKLFRTPTILANYAMDYIDWCADNPIFRYESVKSGINAGMTFPVQMPRVYSMQGFAIYLGISARTLRNYGSAPEWSEFHDVYSRISDIFDNDKLENALVGNYDPRLAATILGIRERQELQIIPTLNFDKDDAKA